MNEQFEVIVESKPLPDGEERLGRVFDVLLSPIANGQEEAYPVESDQAHLTTDDTPDMADSLPTPPLATP